MIWSPSPSLVSLGSCEVHIWRFTLDPPPEVFSRVEPTLNADELRRADRFKTPTLRRRFVAGRGGLRAILASCLNCPANEIDFSYGEHGKPKLATPGPFEFNLAHTHDSALCAVTRVGSVGVDIESLRSIENSERIIARFFSPLERAEFLSLPLFERHAAFFRGWTRKEAFLKATGTGLATELDSFDVSLRADTPETLIRVGDDPFEASRWTMHDLEVGDGFAAALAVNLPRTQAFVLKLWDRLPVQDSNCVPI